MNTLGYQKAFYNQRQLERAMFDVDRARTRIVAAIWVYFLLVLFDGALRKWFLPSLSAPLLILRDPVALWILIAACRRGFMKWNQYNVSIIVIGVLAIYIAFFIGHGDLRIAIYGARIFLLHFPVIFVIGVVLNKNDLLNIARWTVLICIPMTMLIVVQFYSPQSAWINKTVGGEAGGGFSGAMNYYRPPGTFSFTNGTSLFYSLATCFIIYFWFNFKEINRFLLFAGSIALLIAIPISISRTLLFQVVISLGFAIIAITRNPKYIGGLIMVATAIFLTFIVLSFTPYFTIATTAFLSRFDSANTIEGGLNGVLMDRFLGGLIQAIALSSNQPFFGYGIGMGTNVGSMLLTGGRQFLISEGEWGRIIGELGPIGGLTIIFFRLKLALSMLVNSFNKLTLGIIMPWILASAGALSIAQAGWAQPTSLGFCVVICGFLLASLQHGERQRLGAALSHTK